jgi:hypothetical protein
MTDLIDRLEKMANSQDSGLACDLLDEAAQALRDLQEITTNDGKEIGSYRDGTGLRGENRALEARIKELEGGSCRFNCRKVGKLHKIIDRIEKHSEKTVHAPKYRLVLHSDLQDLIRERKGEKDKR